MNKKDHNKATKKFPHTFPACIMRAMAKLG